MSAYFNPTIAALTVRATLGRRRAFLFAIPAVILIALTLVLRASRPGTDVLWPDRVLGDFGFSVLLPLTALIVGTGVLGAEIDDGSAIHLLATPVSRGSVVVTKFAVAAAVTALFAAVPELLAGLLAPNSTKLAVALFIGALAGSVIYSAVFVLASVLTTRAIAFGLLYVLIWEGLLSNLVGGARILSIAHYCLGIANAIHPDTNLNAGLSLGTSVILGGIVTVGFAYCFGMKKTIAHAVVMFALTLTVVALLAVVYELNYPFSGIVKVSPEAFRLALVRIEALN